MFSSALSSFSRAISAVKSALLQDPVDELTGRRPIEILSSAWSTFNSISAPYAMRRTDGAASGAGPSKVETSSPDMLRWTDVPQLKECLDLIVYALYQERDQIAADEAHKRTLGSDAEPSKDWSGLSEGECAVFMIEKQVLEQVVRASNNDVPIGARHAATVFVMKVIASNPNFYLTSETFRRSLAILLSVRLRPQPSLPYVTGSTVTRKTLVSAKAGVSSQPVTPVMSDDESFTPKPTLDSGTAIAADTRSDTEVHENSQICAARRKMSVSSFDRKLIELIHMIWCAIGQNPSLLTCFLYNSGSALADTDAPTIFRFILPYCFGDSRHGFVQRARDCVVIAFSLSNDHICDSALRKTGFVQTIGSRAAESFSKCFTAATAERVDETTLKVALQELCDRLAFVNTLLLVSCQPAKIQTDASKPHPGLQFAHALTHEVAKVLCNDGVIARFHSEYPSNKSVLCRCLAGIISQMGISTCTLSSQVYATSPVIQLIEAALLGQVPENIPCAIAEAQTLRCFTDSSTITVLQDSLKGRSSSTHNSQLAKAFLTLLLASFGRSESTLLRELVFRPLGVSVNGVGAHTDEAERKTAVATAPISFSETKSHLLAALSRAACAGVDEGWKALTKYSKPAPPTTSDGGSGVTASKTTFAEWAEAVRTETTSSKGDESATADTSLVKQLGVVGLGFKLSESLSAQYTVESVRACLLWQTTGVEVMSTESGDAAQKSCLLVDSLAHILNDILDFKNEPDAYFLACGVLKQLTMCGIPQIVAYLWNSSQHSTAAEEGHASVAKVLVALWAEFHKRMTLLDAPPDAVYAALQHVKAELFKLQTKPVTDRAVLHVLSKERKLLERYIILQETVRDFAASLDVLQELLSSKD